MLSISRQVEHLALDMGPVDRTKPVADQIVQWVAERVEDGRIPVGSRLPAIRDLAGQVGVNRNTVALAYKELAQKGYLAARFGGGSTVRRPDAAAAMQASANRAAPPLAQRVNGRAPSADWERRFASRLTSFTQPPTVTSQDGSAPINLFQLQPHTGLFPTEDLRLCLNTVLRRNGEALLNYGTPAGYLPLRERIAVRLRAQGMAISPAQVLITSGSQQGIDLLARAFLNPGDGVVVESPMYSIALKILLMNGATLLPYPVGPEGISLAGLQGILARAAPKLFYAVPNFQNPTAYSYTLPEKRALLEQVYRSGALLIEDASDAELQADAAHRPSLAALDTAGQVMHLNTFSKTLVPAVRVGYLAGPAPVVHKLTELKEMTDLSHTLILQAATAEFMARGLFDKHVALVREFYRHRMEQAVEWLAAALPEDCPFTRPGGGLCTWVDLPGHLDSGRLYQELGEKGVLVSPGTLYQPAPGGRNGLRLCVTGEPEARLREGIRILGEELHRVLRNPARPAAPREYQSIH
jgi:GntR family transcriptional regulator/MocR family aminotransferase